MEKIPSLNWAVAEIVCARRMKAGLTQSQLAGLAGLSEDYISALERGKQGGSLTAIVHIAMALRVNLTELVSEIDQLMQSAPRPPQRRPGKPAKTV